MIHSPRFTVVTDACVLYPAPIRDLTLSMAAEGLLKPKWSATIQNEWIRSLLNNRKDLTEKQLNKTVQSMNIAFPDANVVNFEELIPGLSLPDAADNHVLACAIKCKADLITTFNLKHFPVKVMKKYEIQIQHPDELIYNLIELNEKLACSAFTKMVNRLKNPPMTKVEVGGFLMKCGLAQSADRLVQIC